MAIDVNHYEAGLGNINKLYVLMVNNETGMLDATEITPSNLDLLKDNPAMPGQSADEALACFVENGSAESFLSENCAYYTGLQQARALLKGEMDEELTAKEQQVDANLKALNWVIQHYGSAQP